MGGVYKKVIDSRLAFLGCDLETASADCEEAIGGPYGSHQPVRRVRFRLQKVVSYLVCQSPAESTADHHLVAGGRHIANCRHATKQILRAGQ